MTREEIVKSMSLQDAIQVFKDTNCYGTMDIAKSVILKALEQEPTTKENLVVDCIDRKKLIDWINAWGITPIIRNPLIRHIQGMSSVTSIRPKGHWFVDERPESDREIICSNCEQPIFKYHKMDFDYRPNYCPNCGAEMESEVEE